MGNVKIKYLYNEIATDRFCGWAVTGINPFTSEFSVSCFYFELNVLMNEKIYKYLKDVVAYVHF